MDIGRRHPLILDGATGSNLGLPQDTCTELWILEHPEKVVALQKEYVNTGCGAILTPTSGANRARLASCNLTGQVGKINALLCDISRQALSGSVLLGGSMSYTGVSVRPFGECDFTDLLNIYREQALALKDAGVDFLICESISNLSDARAALLAGRETGLPVLLTVFLDESGYTLSGMPFLPFLIILESLGADAVGINCSDNIQMIADVLLEAADFAEIPLIAKPGLSLNSAITPELFAQNLQPILEAGASIIGGCCGTTPSHMAALCKSLEQYKPHIPREVKEYTAVANEKKAWFLNEVNYSDPVECGISLLDKIIHLEDEDANVILIHLANQDDVDLLIEIVHMSEMPIALRADDIETLEAALLRFPGRALVDIESQLSETELRITAAKYGAVVY